MGGLVPVEVGDYTDDKFHHPAMTRVEFTEDIECSYDEGKITLGHIEIDTDPDEDDECYGCGEREDWCICGDEEE